jgi:hypothetical protein
MKIKIVELTGNTEQDTQKLNDPTHIGYRLISVVWDDSRSRANAYMEKCDVLSATLHSDDSRAVIQNVEQPAKPTPAPNNSAQHNKNQHKRR